jgi:hypothetical protein
VRSTEELKSQAARNTPAQCIAAVSRIFMV